MRQLHLRQWMVILLCGFMQQPLGHTMNPLGLAYFAAAYMWPEHRPLLPVVALIGMAVEVPQTMLLKYLGILIGVMLITYILEWKKAWISQHKMLLMLSLLILSADIGYGLAREGLDFQMFGRQLRLGGLEAVFGAAGYMVFYAMMNAFLKKVDRPLIEEGGEKNSDDSENEFLRYRLGDMAASFRKLSHMMGQEPWERIELSEDDKAQAFSEITEKMCADCGRRTHCWENAYYDTCHSAYNLLALCSEQGRVEKSQVPAEFRHRCIHMDHFLDETNRVMQAAGANVSWRNRFHENRLAYAGQIGEIAEIMDDLSLELSERKSDRKKLSDRLMQRMDKYPVKIKKITISHEGRMGRRQKIYLMARARKRKCISVNQLAKWVSEASGQQFIPEKGTVPNLSRRYDIFELIEDARYQVVQGVARKTKSGENVSGDSFAFLYPDSGQVLMSLSDGMGSGEAAKKDSEFMIDLLEQMVDTGFGRRSALRMLNSVLMFQEDKRLFSSMDLSVIDLYSGICEFIKIGASSTFIKRGRKVECVTSGSLPMGVFPEMDCESVSRNVFDGDMIIMMTDGVVNCFPHGNETLCDLLSQMDVVNPNVMAAEILNEALNLPSMVQQDDMTVLVCMVCKKSTSVL
ncbi:MAG: SpoIIE family protein phosphatase [Lachnospiraceae bacterium]|nr:SpoIIE family protein phosphatase [Lachnospiraceae bacterium]MBQ2288856.1 SpoIIE family protein phosphatase [Lachnospiraceae bacterium]